MHWRCKTIYLYILFNAFWFLLYAQENVTTESLSKLTDNPNTNQTLNKTHQNAQENATTESPSRLKDNPNTNESLKKTHQNHVITNTSQHQKNTKLLTDPELQLQLSTRMVVTHCKTPNGDEAYCLPLKKCSKLMNQLENENAKSFLRKSRCGPKNEDSTNPQVCCGKYDNFKNLVESCGHQNVTMRGRIMGGTEASLGEFPWLARLIHRDAADARMFGCSGFLIAPKFVLTAGHCLKSENIQILGPIYEVQLGEHNTKTKIDCNAKNTTCADKPQIVRVKKTFVHHSYKMNSHNHHHDIGLIYLKKVVKFTNYISPICIMEKSDFQPFEYWLSGWGTTETAPMSHIKMKVAVPSFSHSNCTTLYHDINVKIINKQLCAGGKKNKDSCTGDSGGPLMVVKDGRHWFAAGVVSYGIGCGREGWPAVYTNITSYTDWILNTMSETLQKEKKPKIDKKDTKT